MFLRVDFLEVARIANAAMATKIMALCRFSPMFSCSLKSRYGGIVEKDMANVYAIRTGSPPRDRIKFFILSRFRWKCAVLQTQVVVG